MLFWAGSAGCNAHPAFAGFRLSTVNLGVRIVTRLPLLVVTWNCNAGILAGFIILVVFVCGEGE